MVILSAVGTCALRGGRSATNATNPGVEVGSSTQQGAGEAMPGEVGGVAGSCFNRSVPCFMIHTILPLMTIMK